MDLNKNIKTKRSMNYKILGAILIVAGVAVISSVLYHNSQKRRQSIVFSPKFMLSALWNAYKKQYWEADTGRTIDKQRNNITTSEGQSYTMLRAVWQDDKPTFDKTWQWTQNNLQRPNDHLFSWLYGERADKSFGILTDQGGSNSATDADTDIATALLLASGRWQDPAYAKDAKNIITDIWNNEVVSIKGVPYVMADNLEKNSTGALLVNPSYLAPYAYRLFAQVDPDHNWNALISSSYDMLNKSASAPLDKSGSAGLFPNWVLINRQTGQLSPPVTNGLNTDYGYDALRTPFRIALDWQWNQEPRAQQALNQLSYLSQQWQNQKILFTTYSHDGQIVNNTEAPAMYGGSLGYFLVVDPKLADNVYKSKLQNLYSPDFQDWKTRLSYYDDNWAWFGLALYNQELPNLFRSSQTGAATILPVLTSEGINLPELTSTVTLSK